MDRKPAVPASKCTAVTVADGLDDYLLRSARAHPHRKAGEASKDAQSLTSQANPGPDKSLEELLSGSQSAPMRKRLALCAGESQTPRSIGDGREAFAR